jgi:hypothetical protein
MNITEVIPQDNYTLYVKTEDGKAGLFDVRPYLESEVFAPLKDVREFKNIRNGKYYVEWGCGADLSADTIQTRWSAVTESTQHVALAK